MGFKMRKKGKYKGAEKFAEKMRSIQEQHCKRYRKI